MDRRGLPPRSESCTGTCDSHSLIMENSRRARGLRRAGGQKLKLIIVHARTRRSAGQHCYFFVPEPGGEQAIFVSCLNQAERTCVQSRFLDAPARHGICIRRIQNNSRICVLVLVSTFSNESAIQTNKSRKSRN